MNVQRTQGRSREASDHKPGSVAETMAPKKRQSVKKKSPLSCPTTFMKDTNPYMINLGGGDCDQRRVERNQGTGGRRRQRGGSHQQGCSPDNKAGNDGSQEGVGQDGADVPEEMSLWGEDKRRQSQTESVDRVPLKAAHHITPNLQLEKKCAAAETHARTHHDPCPPTPLSPTENLSPVSDCTQRGR